MKTTALDIAVGIVLALIFMKCGELCIDLSFALSDKYDFHRELSNGYLLTGAFIGGLFPVIAYYTLRDKG